MPNNRRFIITKLPDDLLIAISIVKQQRVRFGVQLEGEIIPKQKGRKGQKHLRPIDGTNGSTHMLITIIGMKCVSKSDVDKDQENGVRVGIGLCFIFRGITEHGTMVRGHFETNGQKGRKGSFVESEVPPTLLAKSKGNHPTGRNL